MEKTEKELLDELKNFDITTLYQKGSYIDFLIQNFWTQGYILKNHQNNKYDIAFILNQNQVKAIGEISSKFFGFFGENSFKQETMPRGICFNKDLYQMLPKQILQLFNFKLKKANIELNNDLKSKKKINNKNDSGKKDINKSNDEKSNKDINGKSDKDINNEQNKEIKNNIDKTNEEEINNKINDNNKIENNELNNLNLKNKNENINEKNKNGENVEPNNLEKEQDKNKSTETISTSATSTERKTNESSISSENNNGKENNNNNNNENNSKNNKENNSENNTENKNNSLNQKLNFLTKLDKNGNPVNVSGYYTFQFLGGFLLDCLILINNDLASIEIDQNLKDLMLLSLDVAIYVTEFVCKNINKLRSAINNRKLTIVSQTHAILASFELILNNFSELFQYDFSIYPQIDEKLKNYANNCYSILKESQESSAIPFKLLIDLINFLVNENVRYSITDFDENQVYKVFLAHIENMNESELKNIKNNELMRNYCRYIVQHTFKHPKMINANTCYYSFLINCLKCNSLEKKMSALNDINDLIENRARFDKIDQEFYNFFVKKNKILDFFFEESIHEELLKRSNIIFKYLASFNKLSDDILEKLIKEQKNDAMKNILCDVISELPSEKKNLTFNHLIKNLNFDENKSDIEYISRLTESCFSSSNYDMYQKLIEKYSNIKEKEKEEKNGEKDAAHPDNEKKEKEEQNDKKENDEYQNYYGLTLLFDYIIKDFNDKKPFDKNNVNFAIEAFNHIIQFASNIESKDITHFMDLLFDNIKSNEKHNSVIQSLLMIKKLLYKFYEQKEGEEIVKKLDDKYHIISLIVNDLISYIDKLPKEEDFIINENEIYEGIYSHKINIEERLDLIFIFVKGELIDYSLKIGSEHIEKLYKLFKPKKFKKEMERLLNSLSRNLIYIDNEAIKSFYNDILLNPKEFDIINFTDLYTLNIIIDLFYKINHDNNMIIGYGKKLRVLGQNIEGFDLLFDILVNNKNRIIQEKICKLLCDLCLNLKDYKTNPEKYWQFFIDKITNLFIKVNNENNINGLNGIINLIDIIYNHSCDFNGIIPDKNDTHQVEEPFELYQFHCGTKKHKDYKIRVGKIDTIYEMRWKIGYYYDIPVNNVVLVDKNGKKYSFIDDNENFFDIFPPNEYSHDGSFVQIKVFEITDILFQIKNNPKKLIEENENILKILIENLSIDKNLENDIKQKIYNIIRKFPNESYIDKNIKSFGMKEKISDEIIKKNFNYDNIYILSYNLHCFDFFIKNKTKKSDENTEKEKEEFLDNFIGFQDGEKLLYDILLESTINYENICYIQFECIIDIINLIIYINKYKNDKNINKKNYEYLFDNIGLDVLLKKLSDIIIYILKIKYNDINEDHYTSSNINYKIILICDSCKLLDTIIHFIDDINSENKTYYLNYLLINQNLFKEIFLFNYITCKEEKLIEILHNYFLKNIFEVQKITQMYLEIMFIPDVFKYLIENDMNGNYFKMLTSIIQKCNFINKPKKENINDEKVITSTKQDSDHSKNNNENKNEIKENNSNIITKELENNKDSEKDKKNQNDKEKEENLNQKEDENKEIKENIEASKIENEEKKEENDKGKEGKEESKKDGIENVINKDVNVSDKKEDKFISQFKILIDLIIEHINLIYEQKINKEDILSTNLNKEKNNNTINILSNSCYSEKQQNLIKNNKIEGIISFLQSILNLSPELLVEYLLSKVDIIDLFLNKCILSKCNLNPLESEQPLCNYTSTQDSVFQLIIFILRNISPSKNKNLYFDIVNLLSKYHQIGFWKTNSIRNWELETSEINKQKYIGLKNMSSICYLNSILQQIFMIPMLRETLLSIENPDKDNVLFQLQLLFSALKLYESQCYDPASFVVANKLSFYEQMDADEYFGIFIDKIENDIKNLYMNDNKYKDLFRFFFGIKALDELKFVDCGHKRYNEFFYNNIQLEVKGFNNLNSSLKNYFKTEIMDGENKINCEGCNMKRTCHKRQIFKSLPNILVINLKRFEFDYNTMLKSKLDNYFEFPFELDMKEYLIENHQEINTKYELTGITIHFGFSDYGHYYDLIKSPDGKWYKFNDNCVYEFDEKDIPHEAFGEKECEDDFIKDIEDKDSGQNTAYILIYKKHNFDVDSIENISKNYLCNLASPPYDKFSNINKDIKTIINIQMFKFWTIQSIVSPGYQNFVINLLKIDLVQNISIKSKRFHSQLFNILESDGYKIQNKIENKTDHKIFEFGLKYFFNVVLRIAIKPKDREYLPTFIEIIKVYIENDVNKAKFILEEFSNTEIINEYLVYCPIKSSTMATDEIINFSFKKLYEDAVLSKNKNDDDIDFILKFINTYVLFISYNINTLSIENVNATFYKILRTSSSHIFINYLKEKKLEKWLMSFFNDDDDEDEDEEMYLNAILSEEEFPKLKSSHKILAEKLMTFEGNKIDEKENDNEMDKQYLNRLKDTSGNVQLIKRLYCDFQLIE